MATAAAAILAMLVSTIFLVFERDAGVCSTQQSRHSLVANLTKHNICTLLQMQGMSFLHVNFLILACSGFHFNKHLLNLFRLIVPNFAL